MATLIFSQAVSWFTAGGNSHSHITEPTHHLRGGPIPLLASPVDPGAYAWLKRKRRSATAGDDSPALGKIKRSFTVAQFEEEHGDKESKLAGRIFRKQHAASSLELFFDLFFVANLAIFTTNHEHFTIDTVLNYLGFFSILWTTWFHISIHDVRFYVDSVFSRFIKLIQFGIMVSFVGLGAVYDAIDSGGSTRAFQGLALVLMTHRFILCVQYLVVLYFVHGFQKTLIPLFLHTLVYLSSGVAFLVTYITDTDAVLDSVHGARHVNIWYIIIGLEAMLVIVVSSIWRVLSFKHTHMVERVGLLTLIVIGEGIIGMTKSTAYAIAGTEQMIWGEVGLVASCVLLIYLIYMLYFDSIDHERFGSIRQQIWCLLHFALHATILLTVEGQSALIIWDACQSGVRWFYNNSPSSTNPASGYGNLTALVKAVNTSLANTEARYHYKVMSKYYDYKSDVKALNSTSNLTYASQEWNATASEIMQRIQGGVNYFLFVDNFNSEYPKEVEDVTDPNEKILIIYEGYRIVFEYFFIAAGLLLCMLAIMMIFGNTKKKGDEWASIAVRLAAGMGLPFVSLIAFREEDRQTTGFRFETQGWIIPIAAFGFLLVKMVDNVVCTIFYATGQHKKRNSVSSTITDEESHDGDMTHGGPLRSITIREPNMKQRRVRMASDDSERTLAKNATMPASFAYNSRGYSTVEQNDTDRLSLHMEESPQEEPPKGMRRV